MLVWSLMKRGDRFQKYGFSNNSTILGLTIKFVDEDKVLGHLRCLCKDLNEILRDVILKQRLLRSDLQHVERKRKGLWLQILRIDPQQTLQEYEQCRSYSQAHIPKNIEESINVDVKRSFNNMIVLTHDNLSNILKTYAVVNPNLNYCQGMNYMAGFLYLALGYDESLAFGSMKEVIERYSMS